MQKPVGLVLGSGLGSLVEHLETDRSVSYAELGLPESGVPGHEGCCVFGTLGAREVLAMRGRVHLYEGHGAQAATEGIRWLAEQGVDGVVLTNAAGSLEPTAPPGSWMLIEDHLNLTGTSPLEGGPNFVDMSEVYDAAWRLSMSDICRQNQVPLSKGVYAGLRGPQYETPAEVRMLAALGASAVGMSTVLEAMQAKALGLRVLGLSCLTNFAAGMPDAVLDHGDVVETGQNAATQMIDALKVWLPRA